MSFLERCQFCSRQDNKALIASAAQSVAAGSGGRRQHEACWAFITDSVRLESLAFVRHNRTAIFVILEGSRAPLNVLQKGTHISFRQPCLFNHLDRLGTKKGRRLTIEIIFIFVVLTKEFVGLHIKVKHLVLCRVIEVNLDVHSIDFVHMFVSVIIILCFFCRR